MLLLGILLLLCTSALYAQNTTVQLPTEVDSLSSFRVLNNSGITRLQVNSDGGFYLGGAYPTGVIPKEGMGTRLMWYPRKGAFRTGHIDGMQWDDANIGDFSMALGYNTTASGDYSAAIGTNSTASGGKSIAMGDHSSASQDVSIAIGFYALSSGMFSTAIGANATATGFASSAFGNTTTASGDCATAMGNYVSTNTNTGAFIIGDYSTGTTVTNSTATNQMTMRFNNGYRLYTNSTSTLGVYMEHNATAWSVICDRNRKENFRPIDGEQILMKIRTMPITEWNYKGTDRTVRYIGPVAQDFYSAFHLGGTDSLGINSLCIDGVNMAAIQALEKRTAELNTAMNELKAEKEKMAQLQTSFDELKKEIVKMKNDIRSFTDAKTEHENENITLNK